MNVKTTVIDTFAQVYSKQPDMVVRAPGRANLIGDHTDYNDGFVMPLAVDRALWMAVGRRDDGLMSVHSLDFGDTNVTFSLEQLEDKSLPHWTLHIRGAWWLLQQQGISPIPLSVVIASDIPIGGGMSSSAAIGVAAIELALALAQITPYDQKQKALMAVKIENEFMGFPCGVMDQMASAAALDHSAMLLDCRHLEITPVPIPESVRVVVINSNKPRLLAQSGYAERRAQCEAAAAQLGVAALRDVTLEILESNQTALGPMKYKRARHVVTENARTLEMKTVLERGDLARAGELINQSHYSLRDDYESSVHELDVLTDIARKMDGCYGARIMGGGFGGCAVGLVAAEAIESFIQQVTPAYQQQTGLIPEFYVCEPSAGSHVEII